MTRVANQAATPAPDNQDWLRRRMAEVEDARQLAAVSGITLDQAFQVIRTNAIEALQDELVDRLDWIGSLIEENHTNA